MKLIPNRHSLEKSTITALSTRALLIAAVLLAFPLGRVLGNPFRVADLNTTPSPQDEFLCSSGVGVELAGIYIFAGEDTDHGCELWISDGSVNGTALFVDVEPGPVGSNPRNLTRTGAKVFFSATTFADGTEVWVTDGTPEGTRRLTDLASGNSLLILSDFVFDGTVLFFTAHSSSQGSELAVWDGTQVAVLEIVPGGGSSSPRGKVAAPGGGIYFSAVTPTTGDTLWRSDGTAAGTELVPGFLPSEIDYRPRNLTFINSSLLLLSATFGGLGNQLVSWDTIAEVETIFSIERCNADSGSEPFAVDGQRLYYTAQTSSHGCELWRYSSADGSNVRLTDIQLGAADSLEPVTEIVAFGDGVCFTATELDTGEELWCYDETNGTAVVKDINPGLDGSDPRHLTLHDGALFFAASTALSGDALWRRTEAETDLFVDFNFGQQTLSDPLPLISLGTDLLVQIGFYEAAGVSQQLAALFAPASWLWLNSEVEDASSLPTSLEADGQGGLRFSARRPDIGNEPWVLDSQGTRLIEDVVVGTESLNADEFLVHSGRTLMIASSSDAPREPYRWDGGAVQQINLLGAGDSNPEGLYPADDLVLTLALNASGDRVMWALDPTSGAAEELIVGVPFAPVISAGNAAFFTAFDTSGGHLWRTDGTLTGTMAITTPGTLRAGATLVHGEGATLPLVVFLTSSELWASDGTSGGTVQVLPSISPSFPEVIVGSENRALFVSGHTGFREFFVTDGTAAGTSQLTQRGLDGGFSAANIPRVIGATGGGWFYVDEHEDSGSELWFTDGITTTLIDLVPGAAPSMSSSSTGATLGDVFVFSAFRADRGFELWSSDGTVAGTKPLGEILPGPAGQEVEPVASGSRVFFSAVGTDGAGHELWAWEPSLFEDGFESGGTTMWSTTSP